MAVCLQYENIICTQPSLSLGVEMAQAFADGPLRYAGGHLLHSSLRPVMNTHVRLYLVPHGTCSTFHSIVVMSRAGLAM